MEHANHQPMERAAGHASGRIDLPRIAAHNDGIEAFHGLHEGILAAPRPSRSESWAPRSVNHLSELNDL